MREVGTTENQFLGAGRSGQVFLIENQDESIARKIFAGDKLTKLVHYIFLGAPNPYIWDEDIIQCAYYRRKILGVLVEYWFNSQLKVADAIATDWNQEQKAYQIDTEFVDGRGVSLCQPFTRLRKRELPDLVHQIMLPLQKKLIEAGFDGLVWQAGKGNPVALNNFLLTNVEHNDTNGKFNYYYAWIDLESGVPALAPLNILKLFSYYIPMSIKHGQPLFDDVDVETLKKYLEKYNTEITEKLGKDKRDAIATDVQYLEQHQSKWKSLNRVQRSIQYQLKKGKINQQQSEWYSSHIFRWYLRELVRAWQKILRFVVELPLKIIDKLKKIQYRTFFVRVWKILILQRYRLQFTRDLIRDRIDDWEDRTQLIPEEAEFLRLRLDQEHGSGYLVDFSIHVALKIIIQSLEFIVLPLLYAIGIIDEVGFGLLFVVDGPIFRSIYTGYKCIQAITTGQEIPWIAFLVGLIPFVGTVAYPCQLVYSTAGKRGKIAQFIVYDTFTQLGEKIPIWGGEDTLTEHFFNQLAYKIIQFLNTYIGGSRQKIV
ncbi:hypothetical protein [Gloeocapsopsis dulcis]|uniref:Uncharacterized protein n=1 Tax=Gloeocapsopsis dulcis AAB1 = 1H9 TaxID=1433147 RepID=A0A6N8G4K9_9CHRO|nr:hypothetical protein [Gloeocapsopsis dulcis]MUL38896.1 hypothetical protein [Gloeocapsopsis dulcis AAB1 = 1H9]WNN88025.1 hypothetical protein P0S91_17205 [Gloeocapsopsis dulcis]